MLMFKVNRTESMCVYTIVVKQSSSRLDSNENNGCEAETVAINDYVESDSLEEDLQKAISTAERRKVFPINLSLSM